MVGGGGGNQGVSRCWCLWRQWVRLSFGERKSAFCFGPVRWRCPTFIFSLGLPSVCPWVSQGWGDLSLYLWRHWSREWEEDCTRPPGEEVTELEARTRSSEFTKHNTPKHIFSAASKICLDIEPDGKKIWSVEDAQNLNLSRWSEGDWQDTFLETANNSQSPVAHEAQWDGCNLTSLDAKLFFLFLLF